MTVMKEFQSRSVSVDSVRESGRESGGSERKAGLLLRTLWRRTSVSFKRKKREDRFAAYRGVRDITVKKGSAGLGIMIIEGRHTEAGRGIFVSDLQEGSAAELAGLQIGDMILAVNRDSLLACTYDAAAAKLKHAEGVVILTVCSPNAKDTNRECEREAPASAPDAATPGGITAARAASRVQTPELQGALATGPSGSSRPQSPRPAPSPVKSEEPATAAVLPNQETLIEISSNKETLGLALLGGSDTLINGPAAVVLDIYKNGAIAKDGRLRVGDQILECNGVQITQDMAYERLCLTIKQNTPKLRLTVYRPSPPQYRELEVELVRKPGRALGLTCACAHACPPEPGMQIYLGEILAGSPAELDGRLQRGDFLLAVDGKEVCGAGADGAGADYLQAAAALKLCSTRVALKLKRFKIVR